MQSQSTRTRAQAPARTQVPPTRYRRLFVFISFIPLYGASFAFSAISLAERVFAPAYLGVSEGIAEVGDPATFPVLNTINLACTATMVIFGIVGLVTFGRKSRLPATLCTSAATLELKNDQALTFYISFVIPLLALALRLSWSAFAAYCVAVGFLMVLLGLRMASP